MKTLTQNMLRLAMLLSLCLLMPKLGICQTGYPKKIVYQGDTVIALTPAQAKIINLVKVDRDKYRELAENLGKQSKTQELVVVNQLEVIEKLKDSEVKFTGIVVDKDSIIEQLNLIIKENTKEVKKLRLQRTILAVTMGVGAVAILFFK